MIVSVFRVISGIGSTMFYGSALGLMIRSSPPDARGRLIHGVVHVGAVSGPAAGAMAAVGSDRSASAEPA